MYISVKCQIRLINSYWIWWTFFWLFKIIELSFISFTNSLYGAAGRFVAASLKCIKFIQFNSRVSSRSRLGQFGKCLGLVSVSGAQVSVLVSVSTQKVLGPSLLTKQNLKSDRRHFIIILWTWRLNLSDGKLDINCYSTMRDKQLRPAVSWSYGRVLAMVFYFTGSNYTY